MAEQVLYRKWRSQTFEEVVGQEHVTRTLQNAIKAGRVAHAYLFAGPRGTGKTTTARILAKAVNCLSDSDNRPCNQCPICKAINEGRCLDLIEIDAASNRGIDEIRDLREKVAFRPNEARYKVYVIDEAHMLTNEAFNALLKTLEEPPPHVIFVLATTEPHKLPPTILSRCQRFDFHRISLPDIMARLRYIAEQEGLKVEPKALEFISRQAAGSLRDAISLLDQLTAYGDEGITLERVQALLGTPSMQAVEELVDHLVDRNVQAGLELINRVADQGADLRQFGREVVGYLRGLLFVKAGSAHLLNATAETVAGMKARATHFSTHALLRMIRLFNRAQLDVKGEHDPQLPLELAFVEAAISEEKPPAPRAEKKREKPQVTAASPPEQPRISSPPPPTMAREPLSLERLWESWGQVLSEVRAHNRSVEALLRSCKPVSTEEEVVILGFPYAFHKEKVQEARAKSLVERAISRVMGRTCRVRCVLISQEDWKALGMRWKRALAAPSKRTRPSAPMDDPLIRAAVSRFGARVVSHQPSTEGTPPEDAG